MCVCVCARARSSVYSIVYFILLLDPESKEEEEERLKKEREKEAQQKRVQQGRGEDDVVINPYPITFRPKTVNLDKKPRNKPTSESGKETQIHCFIVENPFKKFYMN